MDLKQKALFYFNSGSSCSESIVKAGIEEGLCPKELLNSSYAFAGGMGSGCLCGAIAGAQMLIGAMNTKESVKSAAKNFIDEFKKTHKATCCRILSANHEGVEKRQNCANLVSDCAQILENQLNQKV